MRGPAIRVTVSVGFYGPLTPKLLQSIGAKLASSPVTHMVQQVRKKHMSRFNISMGEFCIAYPPDKKFARIEVEL